MSGSARSPYQRLRELEQTPAARWVGLLTWLVVSVVLLVYFKGQFDSWKERWGGYVFEDLHKVLWAVDRFEAGIDPYEGAREFRRQIDLHMLREVDRSEWYIYPPIVLLLAKPLAALPRDDTDYVWGFLNVAMLCAAAWFSARAADPTRPWLPAAVLLLAVGLWPVRFNLMLGNFELPITLILAICAWLIRRGRRDSWSGATGPLLGAAAAVKVFPLFLLPGLWLAERRRTAIVACVAAAALSLAGVAYVGASSIRGFFDSVAAKSDPASGAAASPFYQSFGAFLCRQWGPMRESVPVNGNYLFGPSADRRELIRPLTALWGAAVAGAYLWIEWRRRGGWTPAALAAGIATALMLTPTSEAYSITVLIPAFAVALANLDALVCSRRWFLLAGLAASLVLLGLRASNWYKEYVEPEFNNPWLDNLWVSRVWLGMVAFWLCMLALRAGEPGAEAPRAAAAGCDPAQ